MTLEEAKAILAALVRISPPITTRSSMGDLLVRVANPKMLYRMKKDTIRPQDRADAARIRDAFGLGDE